MISSSEQDNPPFDFEAARRLPENIRFGTSSWKYPGWKDLVYRRSYKSDRDFNDHCLEEYGTFPWFRALGIDTSFYKPLTREDLERYGEQLPPTTSWVLKAWEEITIPRYAKHARYGPKAGTVNPSFLNADLFWEHVLAPFLAAPRLPNPAVFVFEFQRMSKNLPGEEGGFLEKLEAFLSALPKDFRYAVELRNSSLLVPEYFSLLNRHGATHCFNHWNAMPPLRRQMELAAEAGGLEADFFVARILTPLRVSYEAAVKRFEPYDRIKEPQPQMRSDVVLLAKRALKRKATALVTVNNRVEGNAPLTIDAIGREIVAALD